MTEGPWLAHDISKISQVFRNNKLTRGTDVLDIGISISKMKNKGQLAIKCTACVLAAHMHSMTGSLEITPTLNSKYQVPSKEPVSTDNKSLVRILANFFTGLIADTFNF